MPVASRRNSMPCARGTILMLEKSRKVNYESIELDSVETNDYPDFCNAYAVYAEWSDGTPLTEQELEAIPSDVIHDRAHGEFQ